MGGVVFLYCWLFGMGCPALELAGRWVELCLSVDTEISGRALADWYYVGPGGLWWTNVLNSALPSQRLRPDTRPEHQDPVSHTAGRRQLNMQVSQWLLKWWEDVMHEGHQLKSHSLVLWSWTRQLTSLCLRFPFVQHLLAPEAQSGAREGLSLTGCAGRKPGRLAQGCQSNHMPGTVLDAQDTGVSERDDILWPPEVYIQLYLYRAGHIISCLNSLICGGRRDRHCVPLTAFLGKALHLLGLGRASHRHV